MTPSSYPQTLVHLEISFQIQAKKNLNRDLSKNRRHVLRVETRNLDPEVVGSNSFSLLHAAQIHLRKPGSLNLSFKNLNKHRCKINK